MRTLGRTSRGTARPTVASSSRQIFGLSDLIPAWPTSWRRRLIAVAAGSGGGPRQGSGGGHDRPVDCSQEFTRLFLQLPAPEIAAKARGEPEARP